MSDLSLALPLTSRSAAFPAAGSGSGPRPWGVWAAFAWAVGATITVVYYDVWRILSGSSQGSYITSFIALQVHSILGYLVAAGMMVFAARRASSAAADYLGLVRPRLRGVVFGIGCGLVGFFGIFWLLDLLTMYFSSPVAAANRTGESRVLLSGLVLLAHLLWCVRTVIFAPITEELIMRGFLYRSWAASRLGGPGAVLLTALIFGIGHAVNGWFAVLYASVAGLIFGCLRWRTGSTVVCMAAHATWNLTYALRVTLSLIG